MGPDPFTTSAIIVGSLTNGLYSLILRTGDRVGDLAFRKEDTHERLTRNKASFASIVEEVFQDLPPVIEPEEFYEFLNSDEAVDIVKRIYSFGLSDYKNLDNLVKSFIPSCRSRKKIRIKKTTFGFQMNTF